MLGTAVAAGLFILLPVTLYSKQLRCYGYILYASLASGAARNILTNYSI